MKRLDYLAVLFWGVLLATLGVIVGIIVWEILA